MGAERGQLIVFRCSLKKNTLKNAKKKLLGVGVERGQLIVFICLLNKNFEKCQKEAFVSGR